MTATLALVLLRRGDPAAASLPAAHPSAPVITANPAAPPAPPPAAPDPSTVSAGSEPLRPTESTPASPLDDDDDESADPRDRADVVAQIPLFGPTSLRDAPMARPPEASFEPKALARVKVADQTFGEPTRQKPNPRLGTTTEFGQGRLHLPTVYRLRLDEAGGSLRVERTALGFDVIIAGRKVMESGAAISRRDNRIAKVVTRNGTDGTRVSFRFRNATPAYKVRLRKDFVEFFISS